MTTPIASFAGIGSGFNYTSLVNAIIASESQPGVTMQNDITNLNSQVSAYGTFTGLLGTLETASKALRNGTAFGNLTATVANGTGAGGVPLLSASASAGASPGSYAVQVLQTAQAEKRSGASFASSSTALGLAGDFVINGKAVSVASTDTLSSIRDKINATNTGTSPTGVSATIISDSATSQRLVLTSQNTGASGINLLDGAQGVAAQLGWVDTTETLKHPTSSGGQSDNFASATTAIGTQLGLGTAPGPHTVTVGGQAVSIDLGTDTLTSIASKLSALTGISATVQSTVVNGATMYFLDIRNTTSFVDAGNTLQQLGVMAAGHSSIAQVLQGGALTDSNATTAATGATLLTNIWNGGSAANARAGDTLSISGTRGDGSAVNFTFTIAAGSTVQDLLTALNATTAFGGGTRPATASIDTGGHIVLTDGTAGQSSLSLNAIANNQGGGRLDLGTFAATTVGRARELVAGADARFSVDGVTYTRASNTVSDVIANTTLTLTGADPNTTATVNIARDATSAQAGVQAYVDAYNAIVDFSKQQETPGQDPTSNPVLFNDSFLRLSGSSMANVMLSTITGAAPDLSSAGMAGVSLTKDGHLTFDTSKFGTDFATRFNDVETLFMEQGTATNANVLYGSSTSATQPGTYAVNITRAAARATVLGTGFSGTYADDSTPDTLTVTDTGTSNTVGIQLSNGMTTQQIVDALNAAFTTSQTRSLQATAVLNDASGTTPATSATLMTALKNSSGVSEGVVAGDTIGFSGTKGDGTAYTGTFAVSATSTLGDLVASVQTALGGTGVVSIVNGQLTVNAMTPGNSQLGLTVTPGNQGGGSLSFGTIATVAPGHGVLGLTATNVGGQIQIQQGVYGSAAGITIALTGGGTNSTAQLGLTAGTVVGVDVQGTIGGNAATGTGASLVGATGTPVDGLTLSYVGTAIGAMGTLNYTAGVGAAMDRLVTAWTDPGGLAPLRQQALTQQIADEQSHLDDFNARMAVQKASLLQEFLAMDTAVQQLTAQGNALLSALSGNPAGGFTSTGAPATSATPTAGH